MSIPPKTAKPKTPTGAAPLIACTPIHLPGDLLIPAAKAARLENPRNHPMLIGRLANIDPGIQLTPEHIAVLTTKYWRSGEQKKLTVQFLDTPPSALRTRIIGHMNAWNETANVLFQEVESAGMVRVARTVGDGHWSYMGTDILLADQAKPTMNLDGFTMATDDAELRRVVRHEAGHTLGCPHEHMRADLISDIDHEKAIAYYMASQGWTRDQVIQQVLTPISAGSIWGTGASDAMSIMCYQIPANLTINGVTIPGGSDIDATDRSFMAQVYPYGGIAAAGSLSSTASTGGTPSGAAHDPVAEHDTMAKPAAGMDVTTHGHTHRAAHHDCVEIELTGGVRLAVHPDATEDQIRRVVAAVR